MLSYRSGSVGIMQSFTSFAVFLFGALALVVPTGYSIGPALLLLGSVVLVARHHAVLLSRQDRWIITVLVLYGVVVGGLSFSDLGSKGVDRPVRFLFAVPVLLLILRYPPQLKWLWSGIAVGAIGSGSWAVWLKLTEGVERVGGFLHPIQFGNLSMLMGVLCCAGLGWAATRSHRARWVVLLSLGIMLGMLGSFMSGSRGGWVGLPVVGYVLYRGYARQLPFFIKASALGGALLLVAMVYSLPHTGVQPRVEAAISDVRHYVSGGERDTSLGLRFEMWRGAALLIRERPLLGWSESGYKEAMVALGERGIISPMAAEFGHAHNEFLDALAKRGLPGVVVLLLLYLVPIRLFASGLVHRDLSIRSLAVAGTLLPVAFIDFGLSQTFLAHNSGAMFYAFWLAVFWGSYSNRKALSDV
ncbi:O-antigen ligase family protein [Vreelandella stevensii]|uniref:O-antigen ligase family protein n=1 Tax=Vreelandella stevensii TaxID=502821 RepID=UPI003747B884